VQPLFAFSKTGWLANPPTKTGRARTPFNLIEITSSEWLPLVTNGLPHNSISCALLHLKGFFKNAEVADLVGFFYALRNPLGNGVLVVSGKTPAPELNPVFHLLGFERLTLSTEALTLYVLTPHVATVKKNLRKDPKLKSALLAKDWNYICKSLVAAVGDSKEPQPKLYEFFPTRTPHFSLAALDQGYQPNLVVLHTQPNFRKALVASLQGRLVHGFDGKRARDTRPLRKTPSRQGPTKRGHSHSTSPPPKAKRKRVV